MERRDNYAIQAAKARFLWDADSMHYIRYKTMYYAVNLLRQRLKLS